MVKTFKKYLSKFDGKKDRPESSLAFDWLFSVLSLFFVAGIYIDGWAHNHLESTFETFFTPWHALFYGGFLSLAIALAVKFSYHLKRGHHALFSVPKEYQSSLYGVALFFIGGFLDLAWHEIFGIEVSLDALLSPTHLLLALSGAMMVAGPLRAIWTKKRPFENFAEIAPRILSLTAIFLFIIFMLQFAHPFNHPWPTLSQKTDRQFFGQALGITNILLQTIIFMGAAFLVMKRLTLPFWTFAFMLGSAAFGMSFMKDHYIFILPAVLCGTFMDIMYFYLKDGLLESGWVFRAFAFLSPVVIQTGYFLTIIYTEGMWWSVHLWTGSIVMAGIAGWLLSYLVVEPIGAAD